MADKEYKALQKAETGGEKDPWIRTKVNPPGGSTAFGPIQITMSKAIDYANRADQTGLSPDTVKFIRETFVPMQKKMSQYGGKDMKPGFEAYDYGGTGNFKEEDKIKYEKMGVEMIRYDMERSGGDQDKFLKTWRGDNPEPLYKEEYFKQLNAVEFPKQSRLDEFINFINPLQVASAEAGEFTPPTTGRLDEMSAWDKFLTSNVGEKVVGILSGGMTLTEAEALQRQELQALTDIPGQIGKVGKLVLKEMLPRTMPTMSMLSSLIPEMTKDDIEDIAKGIGTITKPMGRPLGAVQEGVGALLTRKSAEEVATETIKGFLKSEEAEPIQRQVNPVKAGESTPSLVFRAVGEAFETLALSSVIYSGGIEKIRQGIRLIGQKNTLRVVEEKVLPAVEKTYGFQFVKASTGEEKAIAIINAAKTDRFLGDAVRLALKKQNVIDVSFLRSEAGAVRAIGVGDYVKAGEKIAKVIKIEGPKAILSLAGKELSKNVAELEVVAPPSTASEAIDQGMSAEEYVKSKLKSSEIPSKGKDVIGRDIPEWREATVFHSTSKEGVVDIKKSGFRMLGKEQGGYYGEAISFTPDKEYSSQFGEIQTTAKISKDAKILNLNDPKDWDIWLWLTKNKGLDEYRKIAIANGIDGVYDSGAGDLFIYNPKKVAYVSETPNVTKSQLLSEYEAASQKPPLPPKPTAVSPGEDKISKLKLEKIGDTYSLLRVEHKGRGVTEGVGFKTKEEAIKFVEKQNLNPSLRTKFEIVGEAEQPKTALDLFKDKSGKVATGMDDAEEFISKTFVPLSTRLSKIDDSLKHKLRKHEFDIGIQNKKDAEKVIPFLKKIKTLSKIDQDELDIALKNANPEEIDTLLKKHNLGTEHQSVRSVLDDLYKRAKDAGMDIRYLDTYFPRKVNDLEGLLDYFANSSQWSMIQKAFDKEKGSLGRLLTDEEKANIISTMVRGFGKNKITFGPAGHTKTRTVSQITPEINKFYKPAIPTLLDYIQGMNTNIAVRNFFGKGKNLDISIGNYVNRLIDQGIISSTNEKELTDVLRAYFNARGTHGAITTFKNFSYMASMGSPISAITQIQDLAFSLYKNGYYNSWMGATHKEITKQDIGIENIADEFTDPSKSSKALTKLFKVIGLDAMDAFGKETLINGAWLRLQKAADKNDPKLVKMLEDAFDKDAPRVLKDFQEGNITDDVKYVLFSELADFQPIALSEMPEYYAKGGNMRIFYMLKSYTIKQLDVYHNEVFRNMKKDPVGSMKNLLKLTVALAVLGVTADTIKDMLLGRKTKLEDMVVDNMLRLVGFSKWQIYKSKQDGFFETLLSSILPPIPFVDDIWKDFFSKAEQKKPLSKKRIWQRLPLVGKFYYWWFGGGKDIKQKGKKITIK